MYWKMSPRYQTSKIWACHDHYIAAAWLGLEIFTYKCLIFHSVNSPFSSLLSSINLGKLRTYVLKLFGGEFIKITKRWHYFIHNLACQRARELHASLSGFETHGSPGSMRARQQWSLFIIISIPVDSGGFILLFLIQLLALSTFHLLWDDALFLLSFNKFYCGEMDLWFNFLSWILLVF